MTWGRNPKSVHFGPTHACGGTVLEATEGLGFSVHVSGHWEEAQSSATSRGLQRSRTVVSPPTPCLPTKHSLNAHSTALSMKRNSSLLAQFLLGSARFICYVISALHMQGPERSSSGTAVLRLQNGRLYPSSTLRDEPAGRFTSQLFVLALPGVWVFLEKESLRFCVNLFPWSPPAERAFVSRWSQSM